MGILFPLVVRRDKNIFLTYMVFLEDQSDFISTWLTVTTSILTHIN